MKTNTFREMRNFLKWYKDMDSCPFTKKGLWEISCECDSSDLEVFWDSGECLTDEQVEKILEDGIEGYNEVENELFEYNYDHIFSIRNDFLRSLDIESNMLTESFKQSIMEAWGCEEDEVVEHAEDELLEFVRNYFDLPVDLKFNDLVKNTPGKVWIDCEDVYWYDTISKETIKKNMENLLYFNNDNSKIGEEPYRDVVEEGLGIPDITELNEPICFSVCVADSLDDYLEKIAKHAETDSEETSEKTWTIEINGKHFVLCGTPYVDESPNYDQSPGQLDVNLVEQSGADNPEHMTFENFLTYIEKEKRVYVEAYLEKYLRSSDKKDTLGRSIVHYAILGENIHSLRKAMSTMSQRCVYGEDKYGITPFSLLVDTEMLGDELRQPYRDEMFKVLYVPVIESLACKNATANCWGTTSFLEVKTKSGNFIPIERDWFDYSKNIFEHFGTRDTPRLHVVDMKTGNFEWLKIETIRSVVFGKSYWVCLDGSIAA